MPPHANPQMWGFVLLIRVCGGILRFMEFSGAYPVQLGAVKVLLIGESISHSSSQQPDYARMGQDDRKYPK